MRNYQLAPEPEHAFDVLAGEFTRLHVLVPEVAVTARQYPCAALRAGVHYLDLTEDIASTRAVCALAERRSVLKDVLEHAVPATYQDLVLVFVTASGTRNGRLLQETYANKIYSQSIGGQRFAAIQVTTAASVCAILDLLKQGGLPQSGLIRQEHVRLDEFLANRFGSYYRQHDQLNRVA